MKTRLKALLLALSILIGVLPLSSCGGKEKFTEYSFDYFDTVTTVIGYGTTRDEFDEVCSEVFSTLSEYHKLFDIYTRYEGYENLCTVNQLVNGAHREVRVDGKIIDLLLFCKQIYELTDGQTNVAMGSVLSIWHQYREAGEKNVLSATLPPEELLAEAAKHTDISSVVIDEQSSTVYISDPDALLDVGAVAKGYAVEMVARELEARGVKGFLINCGGNVRAVGEKPDGSLWTVGVNNPIEGSTAENLGVLSLKNQCLVSSGSYQRFYIVNGKSYHHIIDRETLMPAEGFLQVSVVAEDSGLADGLSTALFCMSRERGEELIAGLAGVEALWVLESGEIIKSQGFDSYISQ